MILKVFDILPAKDENGNDIAVAGTYSTGATVYVSSMSDAIID